MGKIAAGIIFSSLNSNNLSRLTADRTVSAIPFACRYRLIDFALSNMVNADITNISIVANYNYRSLIEHIGSGKDWDLARRGGGINIISPYQTAKYSGIKLFSSHMEALVNMKEYIDEFKEEVVVLMDTDQVLNFDLAKEIKDHLESGAKISLLTQRVSPDYSSKRPRMMIKATQCKIESINICTKYSDTHSDVCLNIFIINTHYLKNLIDESIALDRNSLTSHILSKYMNKDFRVQRIEGYALSISSFTDYFKCSMELVENEKARLELLHNKFFPIYTRVNNSFPVIYKKEAKIENSMIADDCIIEGTVINSIIFRNVYVAKGAIVQNSVLFSGTRICTNALLNCVVTDKNVTVTENINLSGHRNMPFYIKKGSKV